MHGSVLRRTTIYDYVAAKLVNSFVTTFMRPGKSRCQLLLDNLYICANGINNAKYAYNNLQQYDVTWYHRFSKTVHMATES